MNTIINPKKIIICADDFAQNDDITQGIITLCQKKKLSATSCMTNSHHWPAHALLLNSLHDIDKGVHLNLTHGVPLSERLKRQITDKPLSLIGLIKKIGLQQITSNMLEEEIRLQLESFEKHTHKVPNFIDGHQHVHHLPIIRHALLKIYKEKYQSLSYIDKPYLRVSSSHATLTESFWLKKKIIQWLGSEHLKKQLILNNIPFNTHFCGVYPFTKQQTYPAVISSVLASIKDQSLLMCHPALKSVDPEDPISPYRYKEYQFFLSNDFQKICIENNLQISRFERATRL